MGRFSVFVLSCLCGFAYVACQVVVPPGPAGGLEAAQNIEKEANALATSNEASDISKIHTRIGNIMDNIQAVMVANAAPSAGGYGGYGANAVSPQADEILSAAMMKGVGVGFKNKAANPG